MRVAKANGRWAGVAVTVSVTLALGGCAAGQSGTARPSGFLGDYSQLRKGEKGEALLVYVDPQADFGKYTKMMIEPVTIWRDADTGTIPPAEAQSLADDLDDALRITLDDEYRIVEQPGADVLRLRVAITEAEGSWHVEDLVGTKLDPELRAAMPKQPSDETRGFVGKAGIEGEVLDAASGVRLAAAVDRRAGARRLRPDKGTWDDVQDAFRYWAERLRARLAELRRHPRD